MSLPSVDVRLCSDAQCLDSLADFTAPDATCVTNAQGSTIVEIAAGAATAHLQAFGDELCATPPTLETELTLDGAVHFSGAVYYTAALTQACLPPDPAIGYYYDIVSFSGRADGDMGNLDACLFAGFAHCVVQDGATGIVAGACLPHNCGPADVQNVSAPIWGHLALINPALQVVYGEGPGRANVVAHCGPQTFPFDAHAAQTIAGLAVAALIALLATAYALAFPLAVAAQRKRAKSALASASLMATSASVVAGEVLPPLPAALDVMLRAAALTTTVPRLLGTAPPARARDASAPQLDAFDGVRVLSLSLVVLGHSLFFPLSLTGYSNGVAVYAELGNAAMQVIPSAEFAVDSFFALSGALGAFLFSRGLRVAFAKAVAAEGFGAGARSAAEGTRGAAEGARGAAEGASGADSVNAGANSSEHSAPLLAASSLNSGAAEVGGEGEPRVKGGADSATAGLRLLVERALRAAGRLSLATIGAWLYAMVHRYLRLVPSVGVMIAVFMYVAPLLGSGPFWRSWEGSITNCADHAWTNLVFLNNYKPGDQDGRFNKQCTGWLW